MNPLYHSEPYLFSVKTTVSAIEQRDEETWYTLAENIIYPGGGGQLADKARVNGTAVKEITLQNGSGRVCLQKDMPLNRGDEVVVEVESSFRLYNMRQHSGQHLLSALLEERGCSTQSVHLGEEYTLIEVDGPWLNDDALQKLEEDCNEQIRAALPLKSYRVNAEEAARLPLRKVPSGHEQLRIIQIGELDYSACGGTHVSGTSQIGLCLIVDSEKIRGRQRLKILFGDAAYAWLERSKKLRRELRDVLKCAEEEAIDRIEKNRSDLQEEHKRAKSLAAEWLELKAEKLSTGNALIAELDEERTGLALPLAQKLAESCPRVLLLCGTRFFYAAAKEDAFDMQAFITGHQEDFGLRGGGPAGLLQGVYATGRKKEFIQKLQKSWG